jgi:hypothetical protein
MSTGHSCMLHGACLRQGAHRVLCMVRASTGFSVHLAHPGFARFLDPCPTACRYQNPEKYKETGYVPQPKKVERAKAKVATRVRLVTGLRRLLGRKREGDKLSTGYQQWAEANAPKNDLLLYFRWGGSGQVRRQWEGGEAVGRLGDPAGWPSGLNLMHSANFASQ